MVEYLLKNVDMSLYSKYDIANKIKRRFKKWKKI